MKLVKKFLSLFPTKLPVGMTEFETWSDSIIELAEEFADRDSMKFAIASMVIHLDAVRDSAPKNLFVKKLHKTAANQVASQVFQDIKNKQQAAQKAALEAQKAEDTAKVQEKAVLTDAQTEEKTH